MDRHVQAIGRTRSEFLRDAIDQALKRAMDEEVAQAS
jgi:Arc/MetJ-type ribon-helix-helix transcriptional regulator